MPLLLVLGYWQLDRAEHKRHLEQKYNDRIRAAPLSLEQATQERDPAYIRVSLNGKFDNQHLFLLDNKIYQGRVGYEVIAPFILDRRVYLEWRGQSNQPVDFVWVNRGWLPLGGSREQLPEVPEVLSDQGIVASIDIPAGESFVLAEEPFRNSWPEVIQSIDQARMAVRFAEDSNYKAAPFMVRLVEGSPGQLQMIWRPINMSPAKHLGYALQWFSMAGALTILYLYVTIKRIKEDDLE